MQTDILLTKLDNRDISDRKGEIRVFACVRNEVTRLPFLLDYYRRLGVDRFFFVDDKSSDGTTEYLMQQPDCHIFCPKNSYSESQSGITWQNDLLDRYGTGYWTLTVDADELLVYPHCEHMKLPQFCKYLDREGSSALYVFMLDMYPNGDLSKAVCEPGKPFFEICPYFDSEYVFAPRFLFLSNPAMRFPTEDVFGGPRVRKFYPEQKNASFFNQLKLRLLWKAVNLLAKFKIDLPNKPHKSPTLFKVPLIKWHKGCARLSGHHIVEPREGKLSPTTGVLLHFKFFADFHNKAKEEAKRGEHYAGAQEYKRYLHHVAVNPNISFMYEGSVRYINSDSLLEHRLMRVSPDFERVAS